MNVIFGDQYNVCVSCTFRMTTYRFCYEKSLPLELFFVVYRECWYYDRLLGCLHCTSNQRIVRGRAAGWGPVFDRSSAARRTLDSTGHSGTTFLQKMGISFSQVEVVVCAGYYWAAGGVPVAVSCYSAVGQVE